MSKKKLGLSIAGVVALGGIAGGMTQAQSAFADTNTATIPTFNGSQQTINVWGQGTNSSLSASQVTATGGTSSLSAFGHTITNSNGIATSDGNITSSNFANFIKSVNVTVDGTAYNNFISQKITVNGQSYSGYLTSSTGKTAGFVIAVQFTSGSVYNLGNEFAIVQGDIAGSVTTTPSTPSTPTVALPTLQAPSNLTVQQNATVNVAGSNAAVTNPVANGTTTTTVKDPNGADVAVSAQGNFTASTAGNYTVTYTYNFVNPNTNQNATVTATQTIVVMAQLPTVTAPANGTGTTYSPVTVSAANAQVANPLASGNMTVSVLAPNGQTQTLDANGSFTPTVAGNYVVTYTYNYTNPNTGNAEQTSASQTIAVAQVADGWNAGQTTYYQNGQPVTGEQNIGNDWYLFNAQGVKQTGLQDLLAYGQDKVCYYNAQGVMQYNLQTINGKTYYFDWQTGAMVSNSEAEINGAWYYFGSDGTAATGITKLPDGRTVYYNAQGQMEKGLQTIGGNPLTKSAGVTYGFDEVTGALLTNTEAYIGGAWRYFNAQGVMQTGLVTLPDGRTVDYASDGSMQYGIQTVDGVTYGFDPITGAMLKNTEANIDGHWYDFNAQGVMQTGFVTLSDGRVVYYNSQGQMQYGQQTIDGKSYTFDNVTGALQD